jgi:hypothetical protein
MGSTYSASYSLKNRKPVHHVLRSDHEPHRFARRDPYRRRLEGVAGRHNLDVVDGLIGGGRVVVA